jgi:hypothetical protein
MEAEYSKHLTKHLKNVTNDMLTSAAACEEHVRSFELQVVSDGLRSTNLDDKMDVQTLLAKATSEHLKGDVSEGL